MWIKDQKGDLLLNAAITESLRVIQREGGPYVICSTCRNLGEYASEERAKAVLNELYKALRTGRTAFDVPLE